MTAGTAVAYGALVRIKTFGAKPVKATAAGIVASAADGDLTPNKRAPKAAGARPPLPRAPLHVPSPDCFLPRRSVNLAQQASRIDSGKKKECTSDQSDCGLGRHGVLARCASCASIGSSYRM